MKHDIHIYCLPDRLRNPKVKLPDTEHKAKLALYQHPESELALKLTSPEQIIKSMDEARIDTATLVGMPWIDAHLCEETNDYLNDLCEKNNQFNFICSISPKQSTPNQIANFLKLNKVIGAKVNPDWQSFSFSDEFVIPIINQVITSNKFLMTHVDQITEFSSASPQHIFQLAKNNPDLKILAAHGGGLLGFTGIHRPNQKILKNIWFDTAISTTLPIIEAYVKIGIADKIIFGSDFPFNHSHSIDSMINEIEGFNISEQDKDKIFYQNYQNLLQA